MTKQSTNPAKVQPIPTKGAKVNKVKPVQMTAAQVEAKQKAEAAAANQPKPIPRGPKTVLQPIQLNANASQVQIEILFLKIQTLLMEFDAKHNG